MNRSRIMFGSSIVLIFAGILLAAFCFPKIGLLFFAGVLFTVAGLYLLGRWISKAYTYICMDCYLRIDVGVLEGLFAVPVDKACRRLYCPKCRRKTMCKARRISLRVHVF